MMWLRILASLYILSLGFTVPLGFTGVFQKISLPELLFVPLFCGFIFLKIKSNSHWTVHRPDLAFSALFILHLLHVFLQFHQPVLSETLSFLYLILVYYVLKEILLDAPGMLDLFHKAFIAAGVIAALMGITGYLAYQFGMTTDLVSTPDCYFLFAENLIQATGFMNTPNLLFNLVAVSTILLLPFYNLNKNQSVALLALNLLLASCLILAFSKSILLFTVAIIYYLIQTKSLSPVARMTGWIVCLALFIISFASTHFLVTKDPHTQLAIQGEQSCYGKQAIGAINNYAIYPTNYTINKVAALHAFNSAPFVGIGPGMFNPFVGELKNSGLYPAYFPDFDPHSTYMGILAEMGIAGFLVLLWMLVIAFRMLQNMTTGGTKKTSTVAMQAVFLFLFMEAFSLDILHFRHLWVVLALLCAAYYIEKRKTGKIISQTSA